MISTNLSKARLVRCLRGVVRVAQLHTALSKKERERRYPPCRVIGSRSAESGISLVVANFRTKPHVRAQLHVSDSDVHGSTSLHRVGAPNFAFGGDQKTSEE